LGKDKVLSFMDEAKRINPSLNLAVHQSRVEPNSAITSQDEIWEGLDLVICAIEDRVSKNYLSNLTIWHEKPMITSIISSLKGATQVILPRLTEPYTDISFSSREIQKVDCWNFPYTFEHAVEWAIGVFENILLKMIACIPALLQDKINFLKTEEKKKSRGKKRQFRVMRSKSSEILAKIAIYDII
jgi:ubiquitin-activating enzyme E1